MENQTSMGDMNRMKPARGRDDESVGGVRTLGFVSDTKVRGRVEWFQPAWWAVERVVMRCP